MDLAPLNRDNGPERRVGMFFYGLNMDPDTLRAKGVPPRPGCLAVIEDHAVIVGVKAMLLRRSGARAYGIVYRLSHVEIDRLYAAEHEYRAQAYLATLAPRTPGASQEAVLSMVHVAPPIDSRQDPAYLSQWRSIATRLGIAAAGAADALRVRAPGFQATPTAPN